MAVANPTPPSAPERHRGWPPGIDRDPWMLRLLGIDGVTVDPDSLGATALRQTDHYKDAYREGEAWSKAEIAAGPDLHRGTTPDAGGLDIFALNATANGWIIGQKLTAQGNHIPRVPANQMDVLRRLGREPVDLDDLWRYIDERKIGGQRAMSSTGRDVFLNEGDVIPSASGGGGRGGPAEGAPGYATAGGSHLDEFEDYGRRARINGDGYSSAELRAMARGAELAERQGLARDGIRAMSTRDREEPRREGREPAERVIDQDEFER
jgi:hypothetical protein